MSRDPRFDVLFEPVRIGPVIAPNRFYQVPHCTGMGWQHPATLAAMRGIKAEGGWGVVNTEYCSIHSSSDDLPAPFCSLWDEGDVRNMGAIVEQVHRHGALAGVELWHGGQRSANHHSRAVPLGTSSMPVSGAPWQCQRMDTADIALYRSWHRDAVRRALEAGFDIIYVYAAHTYLLAQFLDPRVNQRKDSYGGILENRSRLYREVLKDTRDLVEGRAALATRIEVLDEDESGGEERAALLTGISPLVDLFDVTVPDYGMEMGSSRFVKEAPLETYIAHVKKLTGKPVVSVGRFTSPETMLAQVRRGVVDFIGAARPSIADPFLPNKIQTGAFDEIRECIGCNICYANDGIGVPIRCTQNPTMGEEWRKGWHPERVASFTRRQRLLIVGAGPAGLEAAVTLGKRGAEVLLAEATPELGGRVTREARLPRLSEWIRVRDWRVQQLAKLSNVEVYRNSRMTVSDIADVGANQVIIATGSAWRRNGLGRSSPVPLSSFGDSRTFTPDDIMDGIRPNGHIVVFDDDHYYMAAAIAELMLNEGNPVTFVTSGSMVSRWSEFTFEQHLVQKALLNAGANIIVSHAVTGLTEDNALIQCVFTGRTRRIACDAFIPVTSRQPEDVLWKDLSEVMGNAKRIGDCKAPGIIAQAVYEGHLVARELDEIAPMQQRERIKLGPIV